MIVKVKQVPLEECWSLTGCVSLLFLLLLHLGVGPSVKMTSELSKYLLTTFCSGHR